VRISVAENDQKETTPPSDESDPIQHYRDAMEKIRRRADVTAKALGGLGTTALTAIGLAKFGDLYPIPPGGFLDVWWAVVVLPTSFIVIALIIAYFTARLWSVNEPVLMRSDPGRMTDLRGADERSIVETVYGDTAALNDAVSLRAYEARAHRLHRIADRADEETAAKRRSEADEIVGDVAEAQARAAMIIVRRRAANVVRSKRSLFAYFLLAAGVLGFGISADRLESERAGRIEVAKACAEARAKNAANLPQICGEVMKDKGEAEISPEEEEAAAIAELAAALGRCEAALKKTPSPRPNACASIRRAIAAATQDLGQ
jgi:hypothetical protein